MPDAPDRPACISCGHCHQGCRTGAKASMEVTYLPQAVAAGAEIRPDCMAVGIERDAAGRVTAVVYRKDGVGCRRRCAALFLCAGAVETPRLLLHTGIGNGSGTRGAIVVVDLESGKSFRALDGQPSTQMEKDVTVTIGGKKLLRLDGRQPTFAADGIALSNDGKTLFWQALTGRTLYAINTEKLRPEVSEADRIAAVRKVATTEVANGLWMSKAGVLYLTSPGDYSVKQLDGTHTVTVVADQRLRWPDTMSEGPDDRIYVTVSHIQDTSWFTPGAPASVRTQLFSFPPAR